MFFFCSKLTLVWRYKISIIQLLLVKELAVFRLIIEHIS